MKPRARKMVTYDSARDLTDGQLRKASARNMADGAAVNDAFIAAGRGHEKPSDTRKMTDPLALLANALMDEARAIHFEAERRYGPSWIVHV